jgi:DNA-binding LacI/PurR family transcriptional regulator
MKKRSPKLPTGQPRKVKSAPTKHGAVAQTLREEIQRGVWAHGERIPSEQEIAKRFGVAYMTARQAVSSLVAEGVLQRVARKGTFVGFAKPVPTGLARESYVLLIEGGKTSLDPYYLPPIIEAFEREIKSRGFDVAIYDYSRAILDGLLSKDALICCVLLSEPETLYANLLRERGNQVFAINRCNAGSGIPFVFPDNAGGARTAVEHLMDLGHRRIGFIRGLPGNIDGADRRHGYIQAMTSRGFTPGPEDGDHFIEACGYEVTKGMLGDPEPPTAIFCASDLSAIGAMKAIAEAGLSVPNDVSVVGFGDFSMAGFLHPGLTTVRLPMAELGRTAALEMLSMAQGETVGESMLPCELVLRETTAQAPRVGKAVQAG